MISPAGDLPGGFDRTLAGVRFDHALEMAVLGPRKTAGLWSLSPARRTLRRVASSAGEGGWKWHGGVVAQDGSIWGAARPRLSLSLSLSLSGVFERAGREHRRYSRIGVPANAHSFLKITPGGDDAADRIEKVGGPLRGGSHRNAPRVCLKVLAIANHGRD